MRVLVVQSRGSPFDQGVAIGQSIRAERDALLDAAWTTIREAGLCRAYAVRCAEALSDVLTAHAPEAHAELLGIAEGAGWPLADAMVYNHWNYITQTPLAPTFGVPPSGGVAFGVPPLGGVPHTDCTARLALGSATDTGKPILAKNKDYPYRFGAGQHYVHLADSSEGHRFVSYGVKGWVGCDNGVNDAGLCVVLTWVGTPDRGIGVQSHILLKVLLRRCATVADALALLQGIPRTGLCNYLLVDAAGDAVVFENAHSAFAIRRPENGRLCCTNHFLSPGIIPRTPEPEPRWPWRHASSRARLSRASEMLAAANPVTVETMKAISRDHANGPSALSVCAHGERQGDSAGSVGAFIYDAANARVHVASGHPCEAEYEGFGLSWSGQSGL
ncbi:MAG: hypothetical protein FJ279_07470 [Planctomycetes bacterium]|nr:hypothetical protein [Planctomycetota bacterium]